MYCSSCGEIIESESISSDELCEDCAIMIHEGYTTTYNHDDEVDEENII